ncbi:MAG: ROK family transcriptional regulator [Actinomycetota bacterium]|nr:ROK family transcriptional regulator [Actinomycetota bacterium]
MSTSRPTPARQQSLRAHNLALVLTAIASAPSSTRARLAAETGLTKATVSSLVDLLVAADLVVEAGPDATPAAVGRRGSSLTLSDAGPLGIGVEVNVDYLATCTVDLTGRVRRRETIIGDERGDGPDATLRRAAGALRRALDDAAADDRPVAGITLAVPGLVESDHDIVRAAPNLGWRDVRAAEVLAQEAGLAVPATEGVEVRLGNEADLAALGELWVGGHGSLRSFLFVSGEIGVGAGIVVDGALFGGVRGFSGEIGHITVDPNGPPCPCGNVGCLERLAGQERILTDAGIEPTAATTTAHADGPVAELVARAAGGDARALSAIDAAGRNLGLGLSVVLNAMDIDTVLLGGVYALLGPWLTAPVTEELERRVFAAPWSRPSVGVSTLGPEAAVRGAALNAIRTVLDDPFGYVSADVA